MGQADAAALKCPNCGAPSRSGASRCDYCRGRLATIGCPSCFGLIFAGAAFCQHCGAAQRRSEAGTGRPLRCPACKERMSWMRVGNCDLLECEGCDATWIEAAAFERICADHESQAAVLHTSREPSDEATPSPRRVQYRPCLRCGKMMNRVNFGKISGAVVDVCKGHGTFLDLGELHRIVRFIQSGGIDRARAAEREQLADQQRHLLALQREQARLTPSSSTATWNDFALHDLFAKLFDR